MLQLEVATRSIPSSAIGLICPFAGDFFILFSKSSLKPLMSRRVRDEMSTEQKGLRTTMKKLNGDSLNPDFDFQKNARASGSFYLESSSKHEGSGRYSFIGMDPLKSYSGRDGRIEEHVYETGKKYSHEGDLFVLLKRLMPRITDDIDFPFTGGAVGYVGYGAARRRCKSSQKTTRIPRCEFQYLRNNHHFRPRVE